MQTLFSVTVLCTGSLLAACLACEPTSAADPWVVYQGAEGPGKGKHIVLVSGDEEYRSEEALPQLGKILAQASWIHMHRAVRDG